MTSSQISRRLKPPQKVREELQQYLDDDEEDLLKVYATLIGFVQDVNHPTRKQLTWGNGPGQHRDIAIKEFLGFVKDILIPNFLTDEMKKRNPKLSLHKDISNVDITLHEHYFFRTALIKTSQCQRDNSRRQSTQIKDVFDFPSNDEDSSSTDDGPFAANQPQAKKRRLLKSNERRIRPSTERKGSPMPLETSTPTNGRRGSNKSSQSTSSSNKSGTPSSDFSPSESTLLAIPTTLPTRTRPVLRPSEQQDGDLHLELRIDHRSGVLFHCESGEKFFEDFAKAIHRPLRYLFRIKITVVDPPAGLREPEIIIRKDQGPNLHALLYGTDGFFWKAGVERMAEGVERGRLGLRNDVAFVIQEVEPVFVWRKNEDSLG